MEADVQCIDLFNSDILKSPVWPEAIATIIAISSAELIWEKYNTGVYNCKEFLLVPIQLICISMFNRLYIYLLRSS